MFQWKNPTDSAGNPVVGADGKALLGNLGNLNQGLSKMGGLFKGSGSITSKLSSFGQGLGQVAGVGLQAFGVFSMAKGIGKALGLGKAGSSALGGAAAGFSVAGPVGAAIGAVAGLLGGILTKKNPQARASVSVGDNGRAVAGATYSKQGGNKDGATQMASQGASLFTNVANSLESYLTAGEYGTFGSFGKGKKEKQFYSLTGGVSKKGKPTGTAGVDYMIGSPDELSAFAIKSQIKADKFGDLNPIYKTIAQNSTAISSDQINSDLSVGKNYLQFVDNAKMFTQTEVAARDLKKSYEDLNRQSKALGLDTDKLSKAYELLRSRAKDDFNFNVSQGILGIKDPIMAEYNALVKEYENSVRDANAVGGDLTAVEEYYGLQRLEIIKKYAEAANNSYKAAADDLLRQLTASDSSPLNAQTVFANSQDNYYGLMDQIKGGDYSNYDKLSTYTQDYLSAAQGLFSSSKDYYDVFKQVTDFTKEAGTYAPTTVTNPADIPGLPTLTEVQERIASSTAALADTAQENTEATQNVGQTLVETNAILEEIRLALAGGGTLAGINAATTSYSGLSTLVSV